MNYLQSIIDKLTWRKKETPWQPDSKVADFFQIEPESSLEEANILTSDARDPALLGYHYPLFDLDFPCALIESKTPGHFHLFMGAAVPFEQYLAILKAMCDAGLIEQGYYDSVEGRKYGSLRKPGTYDKEAF